MPELAHSFRAGRLDCQVDSPYSDENEELEQREFPEPFWTAEAVFDYYARTEGPSFNLTWEEVWSN